MKNYITKQKNGNISVSITTQAMENLMTYRPKGCPFKDYTMLDLLKDWISMYSWQITQRNISLVDFIKNINGDGKVSVYGNSIIELLTE